MDALTPDKVNELAREHGGVRVTIVMPTRRFGPGSQEQDTTRLRNLLRVAQDRLLEKGVRAADAAAILAPAHALADDRPFWLRAQEGLAIFAGPDGFTAVRLPQSPAETVWVAERYLMRPLLTALQAERSYWLLALSQNRVRLLRGSAATLEEVPVEGIPGSLADALQWEDFEKRSLQFHTGTLGTGGRSSAIFHGSGEFDVKDEIVRYFRGIDKGLHELLKDSTEPLVLAGVDYLMPLYREVNTYPYLVPESVIGNPDAFPPRELKTRAGAAAATVFAIERAQLTGRIEDLWASERTTPDPEVIVPAARNGRIEALLVSTDSHWWGAYDEASQRLVMHANPTGDDDDLLDLAAQHTYLGGGEVVMLSEDDMPHGQDAVAVLRY